MKKIFIIILLFIIFSCAYNRDNDIIATYKGGSIKWQDIKKQAKTFKKMHPDINNNIEIFKNNIINSVVIPKIMAIEAKNSHKNDSSLNQKIALIKEQTIIDTFIDKIYNSVKFKKIAYKLFFIGIKKSDSNNKNITDDDIKRFAEMILSKVKSVRNTSECNSILNTFKNNPNFVITKGIKDYFSKDEATIEIFNAVKNLRKTQYYKDPIRIKNEYYLIAYLMDKKIITNKNIDGRIKSLKTKNQFLQFEREKALREYFNKIKKITKLQKYYNNLDKGNDKILLKIEPNVLITVGDFKYRFSQTFIPENLKNNYTYVPLAIKIPKNISKEQKISFIEGALMYNSLLYNEALLNHIDKKTIINTQLKKRLEKFFDSVFRFDFEKQITTPSDEDIYEYYKNQNIAIPYKQVKEKLKYQLFNRNYSKKLKKWNEDKLKEYKVKFVLENLKL